MAGRPISGNAIISVVDEGLDAPATQGAIVEKGPEACSFSIFGLVSFGDSSVEAAMQGRDPKKLISLERSVLGVNPYITIFGKSCVQGRFLKE
jgi:hypothetical protein